MIYLTGQLLAFLIVTASVGFVLGWILRGAVLHTSDINRAEILFQTDASVENPSYAVSSVAAEQGSNRD